MRTKILIFEIILSMLVLTSCTKDNNASKAETAITSTEVVASQKIDDALDDISLIADELYEITEGSVTGKLALQSETGKNIILDYSSILPACVTVSDLGSTSLIKKWTLTFGLGATTCTFRGRELKGQIIITRAVSTTFPKTMTISLNDFFINTNKIEGTSTWTREMIGTGLDLHPKTTLTIPDLKLISSLGIYTRNGSRTREMIEGFSTRTNPTDNVFSTHGSFTTTHPNGSVYTSLIETSAPLIHKTTCSLLTIPMPFPVSGKLKLMKNSNYSIIDYGNGACDNVATLSINGAAATPITLDK